MTHRTLDIAVIGAGPTGLTAALLLARDGHRVVVCEADADPQEAGTRPGVSQFRLPHVVLPRWHHELAAALPDLIPALRAAGASPFNLLHCQGDRVTGGRQAGDEQFDTVAISRVLLEQVLGGLAADQPGLELCRATRVTGRLPATDATGVRGLRTEHGTLPANLVVDAGGRRSPVPGWLQRLFGMPVTERRSATRLTFYGRHFESTGAAPPRPGPILTHYPSWSLLTLPADHGRYAVVMVAGAGDRPLRSLREADAWDAAVGCTPIGAAWLAHGRPVGDVLVHAGDDLLREAGPVAGLITIGDARAVTNPLLGRGLTLGALGALALRDSLRRSSPGAAADHRARYAERVGDCVDATVWFAGHRGAELRAEASGESYRPDDPGWAMTVALRTGAQLDPVLARGSSRIGGLLAGPAEVFADAEVRDRVGHYLGGPAHPPGGPSRSDLLSAIARGAGGRAAGRRGPEIPGFAASPAIARSPAITSSRA